MLPAHLNPGDNRILDRTPLVQSLLGPPPVLQAGVRILLIDCGQTRRVRVRVASVFCTEVGDGLWGGALHIRPGPALLNPSP